MKLIGAILAGGQSRRMGQDKALLPLGESKTGQSTLLEYMFNKLQACDLFDEIIICRDPKAQRPPGLEAIRFLADLLPDRGPLGALYTLAEHYPSQRALVVPVDMPLLDCALLKQLVSTADHAAASHYGGHYFPLLIHLNKTVRRHLKTRIFGEEKNYALAAVLDDIVAQTLSGPEEQSGFSNINTPKEWRALGL